MSSHIITAHRQPTNVILANMCVCVFLQILEACVKLFIWKICFLFAPFPSLLYIHPLLYTLFYLYLCFSPFRIFWASADSHLWWSWPFLLIFSENVLLIYVHAMTEAKFWFNVFFSCKLSWKGANKALFYWNLRSSIFQVLYRITEFRFSHCTY